MSSFRCSCRIRRSTPIQLSFSIEDAEKAEIASACKQREVDAVKYTHAISRIPDKSVPVVTTKVDGGNYSKDIPVPKLPNKLHDFDTSAKDAESKRKYNELWKTIGGADGRVK
jgi:hypothetical protein